MSVGSRIELDQALAPLNESTRDLITVALAMVGHVRDLLKHPDMTQALNGFRYLPEGQPVDGQELPRLLKGLEYSGTHLEEAAFKVNDEHRATVIRLARLTL